MMTESSGRSEELKKQAFQEVCLLSEKLKKKEKQIRENPLLLPEKARARES